MGSTGCNRGPMMSDSTQDPQGRSGPGTTVGEATAAGQPGEQAAHHGAADAGDWSDAASDPGSGVPGGGRHKYASGKSYCGTEN
jgi:hypothetical protein